MSEIPEIYIILTGQDSNEVRYIANRYGITDGRVVNEAIALFALAAKQAELGRRVNFCDKDDIPRSEITGGLLIEIQEKSRG